LIRDSLSYHGLGGGEMRPRERRETGEQDLFPSRLDQIIDMNHPLMQLARTVDWQFLKGRCPADFRIPSSAQSNLHSARQPSHSTSRAFLHWKLSDDGTVQAASSRMGRHPKPFTTKMSLWLCRHVLKVY
jgi:IS5 family transposase